MGRLFVTIFVFPSLATAGAKISMQAVAKLPKYLIKGPLLLGLLFLFSVHTPAQSTDATVPSPISSPDLSGSISARDIGDARPTHHYYAFGGNPGDVLITVQSRNLNGDIDVFTAGALRPLLKFTLYAESTSPVTKGIYLRRHEDLILRVEARSPNDDEGSYQIRFGGSFVPLEAPLIAEAEKTESATDLAERSVPRGRRVTSAGARINEPLPPPEEVAVVTPTPEPTPEATPEAAPEATPEATPAESPEPAPARATPTRRGRGRATTRRTTPRPETPAAESKEPTTEPENVAKDTEPAPVRPARRGAGRRGARAPEPTPPEPEPPSGPRLVLEMLDGTRVESYLSTIRRITIENNQVVVVRKDGKIDRTRFSDVLRMTIEP